MPYTFANRIKEASTSIGTPTLTLDGAETGFKDFVTVVGSGALVRYTIEAVTAGGAPSGDWEVGIGTVEGGGAGTLTRDAIEESTNSDLHVVFTAGKKIVFIDHSARETAQARVHVQLAANLSIANNTSVIVDFTTSDHEIFDPDGFHEGTTNPERLTVPTGFDGRYLVMGSVRWASNSTGRRQTTVRHKDSSGTTLYSKQLVADAANGADTRQVVSWVFDAEAGDFFELFVLQASGGNLDITGGVVTQDRTSLAAWRIGA